MRRLMGMKNGRAIIKHQAIRPAITPIRIAASTVRFMKTPSGDRSPSASTTHHREPASRALRRQNYPTFNESYLKDYSGGN